MVKRLFTRVSAAIASSALLSAVPLVSLAQSLSFSAVTQFKPGSKVAEIVSVSPNGRTLVYTNSEEKQLGFVNLSDPARPVLLGTTDLSALGEPTSVVYTPSGRLAIAAIKNDPQPGKLVFVNPETRQIVGQVTLQGVGPDSIAITPNGRRVVVAMEDEEDTEKLPGQRPGSINIVTLNPATPAAPASPIFRSAWQALPGSTTPPTPSQNSSPSTAMAQ